MMPDRPQLMRPVSIQGWPIRAQLRNNFLESKPHLVHRPIFVENFSMPYRLCRVRSQFVFSLGCAVVGLALTGSSAHGGSSTIWAVGYDPNGLLPGFYVHSNDSGATWSTATPANAAPALAVDFIDAQTGWIPGGGAFLLHTTDGGGTWTTQQTGGIAAHGIDFLDNQTGWIVGNGLHNIAHTTDGGAQWTTQYTGNPLSNVDFVNAQHGYATGLSGLILGTSDGGSTWNRLTMPSSRNLGHLSFTSALNGWVVGNDLYHTTDGGTTWSSVDPGNGGYYSITFQDALHGWAVGEHWSVGIIARTSDGGNTWSVQDTPLVDGIHPTMFDVGFADLLHSWAVGQGAVILSTSDGGSSWSTQFDGNNVSGSLPLFALSVVPGQVSSVPEPSSLLTALIGGGSVAVVMALRRRPRVLSGRRSERTAEC
jgi:photosystem II stability/assembly factor-like uncharacterized protein